MSQSGRRRGKRATDDSGDVARGRFHEGHISVLVADRYRGVFSSALEAVQNAFDADADRVMVVVDLRDRQAYIADNGSGADRVQLDLALGNIGFSIKGEGSLGRWGIGFISPMVACTTYCFTTWARSDDSVHRLTFREAEIREMRELEIPRETLMERPSLPEWVAAYVDGEFAREWRTIVHMDELKPDRTTSAFDPQEFRRVVRSRFSRVMRASGALVRLVFVDRGKTSKLQVYDIDPTEYHGESLGEVTYYTEDTGEVTLRLWLAPETKPGRYDGEVDVFKTGDNTTVGIFEFSRQALVPGKHLSPRLREVMAALRSGRFAGEIMCELIDLHVERKGFVHNDALFGLLKILVQWYEEHGYIYYEVGREESRESRWRQAGLESERWLSALLGQPRYAALWDSVLAAFGETEGSGGGIVRPTRSGARRGAAERPDKPSGGSAKPDDAPGGDDSKRRQQVGLRILHAPSRERQFWSLNLEAHELTINTGHEVWGQLDETNGRHEPRNARWTQEIREWLVLQVLVLLSRYPQTDEFERMRGVVDDGVPLYADMIVQRDTVRRRRDETVVEGDDT